MVSYLRECQLASQGRSGLDRFEFEAEQRGYQRGLEEAAKWHNDQAELVMNSLHCGDNSSTIFSARRKADWHDESAKVIRALKQKG